MKWLFILLIPGILFPAGCKAPIGPYLWLTGTWEMPKPNGSTRLETWVKKDSKTLKGEGLKVSGGDTTVLEHIEWSVYKDKVFYIPTVSDQNGSNPVPFTLVSSSSKKHVFENPQHDFPQRIAYTFKPVVKANRLLSSPGDTIDVDVTGLDGEGIHFRFTRKK